MAYNYNPLLRLDLQKKQDIPEPPEPTYDDALSDTSENAVQNKVITAKITQMESDTLKKVSKFFTSIEELEVGEIGQYQGETTEEFTHGYFYERGTGERIIHIISETTSNPLYFTDIESTPESGVLDFRIYNDAAVSPLLFSGNDCMRLLNSSNSRSYIVFLISKNQNYLYSNLEVPVSDWVYEESYVAPFAYDEYSGNFFKIDAYEPHLVDGRWSLFTIDGESTQLAQYHGASSCYKCLLPYINNLYIPCLILIGVSNSFFYYLPDNAPFLIENYDANAGYWFNHGNFGHSIRQDFSYITFDYVDNPAIKRVDTQPALDPSAFATSAQGAKADSALQSISKGTDGDYITTTIGAKAGNSQTVSSSLTIQALSNAGASAKGLAEASDVKEYIGNNTAKREQGEKADTALQKINHGADGQFVTTTVTQKANNAQTIYTSLTLQGIATADEQHQGVAEASDVRYYLNIIAATSEAYGVMWDTANPSPTLTRIGNMTNHALLPVQSQMIGGVMADDGTFTPFDNQADWTQATQARDGSDGQVMVRLPKHWRRCSTFGTYNIVMLSPVEIPGYVEVREQYVSAYEASLQRSTLKLSSVNNATADYRGGQNEASWDGTYRTLLNRPVSAITLTEFRTYARNRAAGTSWNCLTYEAVRTIFWLFAVEYATLNSQADYTSELDANGYHQGGLGIGVSDWTRDAWNSFNGYAPLIPCGVLDEYGNGTAVKNFSIYNADSTLAHTFQCNKYRGIEMPFGDIWKYVDGVLINVESGDGVSTAYATIDPGNFSSTSVANYNAICNTYRVDSYIKGIAFNTNGDIFATQNGANSTSYYCDQYWGGNLPSTTELRAWPFGGTASAGAPCGLACAYSHRVPAVRYRHIGSRLCFIP